MFLVALMNTKKSPLCMLVPMQLFTMPLRALKPIRMRYRFVVQPVAYIVVQLKLCRLRSIPTDGPES